MSRKDEWMAEKTLYENYFRAITRRKTKIIDIPPAEGELGYTSANGMIHLARRHPMLAGLSEEMKRFFRMGVFAHEMCHQLFTDFKYLEEVLADHPWKLEKQVIGMFANLVEDPAIEFFAETEFGGDLLAALRFSIAHIYAVSPDINGSEEPFTQLCNALIQFGDMGLLKGKFTSDDAYEYFKQIAPEFNAAVEEPDPRKRIDYAVSWASLTKPLWNRDTMDEENALLDEMKKTMEENGITKSDGVGEPKTPETKPSSDSSKRRDKMVGALNSSATGKKDNTDESSAASDSDKTASTSSNSTDSDADSDTGSDTGVDVGSDTGSDDGTEKASDNAAPSKSGADDNDSDLEDSDASDAEKETQSDAEKENQQDETEENRQEETEENQHEDDADKFSVKDPKSFEKDFLKKLDSEMMETLKKSIEESATGIEKRRKLEKIDYNEKSRHYGSVSALNEVVKITDETRNAYTAEYGRIMKKHARDISLLTASLKKIFQQDTGETIRALSGRYNVVRASKQSTAKIFDRRRAPKKLDDLAVMLLIDESGSMYGSKAVIARETAIILAESLAALSIPCYIMGFTTGNQYDVVHHHYVSWKNTKEERISLAGIHANNSNFDGFSIRNASMILKKRPAEHKILFVVSDGYPACHKYRNMSEGVTDTTEAIQEAKKSATVLGIGIGDCSPEILKHMYKGSFVHASNADELSVVLTKNLKTILKKF